MNETTKTSSACGNSQAHPVVGIGLSSGGLDAFQDFLRGIDPETRASYVIVQDFEADRRSRLLEIVESRAPLEVRYMEDRDSIAPSTIYVLKDDRAVRLEDDRFLLSRPPEKPFRSSGVDLFFASLAEAKTESAVGVILSGAGTDGMAGLRKIKANGGLCLAHTPPDGDFSAVPMSASESGCLDFTGPAGDLARKADACLNARATSRPDADTIDPDQEKVLLRILALLRERAGNDFSDYRRKALLRRVEQRICLSGVSGLGEYLELLRTSESEIDALVRDILVSVSCFFGTSDVRRALEERVIPSVIPDNPGPEGMGTPGRAVAEALAPEDAGASEQQLASKVAELERSYNDVRNLLASTNIAMIFLDDALRVKRFTPAAGGLFNLIESDIGRPISDLTGKVDGDHLIATSRRVLDDLKSREDTVKGLDHAHYLRRILPYRTPDNRIAGVVITFDDITELRKTQEDLIRAERYLRLAIRNSPVIIFAQDLELKYTYILNQPSEYSREDIIGKTDKQILPEVHERLDALKNEVLRTGRPSRQKMRITTKEQNCIWLDITMECLRDSQGQITGLCGASVDITDQVNREAELERAKEGAEAASRAKSRFLSSMSHDIRTPLTSIMSLSEILAEFLDQDHQDIASEIQHACKHLHETLDSVLNLTRLQSRVLELPLEPVDLSEILEEIRSIFDPKRKRVDGHERIRLSADDKPFRVRADKGALLRVLDNLVGNALKFCPDKPIEIRVAEEADYARIEVADQGPGISPEFQKDIFKPFTQERDKQKSSLPGIGLGLSITHELVGLMHGTIEVESEGGRGTTMIVRLPLSRGDATPDPDGKADSRDPSPERAAEEAIICDDHDATCRILRRMLKDRPATVVDAEAELYQNLPGKRTLLLDVNLNGRNRGIEIMRDLRADPRYEDLHIVAFTAHCLPGEKEKFLEIGFDDYLGKPFQRQDLLAKLFPHK